MGSLSQLGVFTASNNDLSSSIPSELVALPLLKFLSLSSNCFSGTLPSCSTGGYGSSLEVLDMNALSSGNTCRNNITVLNKLRLTNIQSGYYPKHFMKGGL